jgi:hypothetical protein
MKSFLQYLSEAKKTKEEASDWQEWHPQAKKGFIPQLSRKEFTRRYRSSSIETRVNLAGVNNTDAEEVVGNPSEMQKRWEKYKPGYKPEYLTALRKTVASGENHPPVIVRTHEGEHLLSGNTRAMIHRADNPTQPIRVRVIDLTKD